jgi:hypothetical protein
MTDGSSLKSRTVGIASQCDLSNPFARPNAKLKFSNQFAQMGKYVYTLLSIYPFAHKIYLLWKISKAR